MAELILVLGGARSGKSRYAEQLAASAGPRVLYVATAETRDAEMVQRVRRHQARRPATWQTVEAPLDPLAALQRAGADWDAVLLDSLTLWLSNRLPVLPHPRPLSVTERRDDEAALGAVSELLAWQRSAAMPLIIVSDEVGLGVVPPYPLGRQFRDLLGSANQLVAAEATRVYYLIAGLSLELKSLGASPFPPERA